MAIQTPVAFCVFNRPDHVATVFERIAQLKPKTLLVFSDGPRPGRPDDEAQIQASRRIVQQIDWDCDLRTDFSEINLGCKRRVSSGISWALEQFEQVIVLEDDCWPHPSFFGFCESLLDRYRDDQRVMAITGDNFQDRSRTPYSYYFSKFPHCWGWATWRRAWALLDLELETWPHLRDAGWLEDICDTKDEVAFWTMMFDKQHAGEINSWAFPWMYSCWLHGGLTALPDRNLISNIGFGAEATHTDQSSSLANLPTFDLGEIRHPPYVHRARRADLDSFYRLFYQDPPRDKFTRRVRNRLRLLAGRTGSHSSSRRSA